MYRKDPSQHLLTLIENIEQTIGQHRQLIDGLTQEKNEILEKYAAQQQQIDGLIQEKNEILQKFASQQQQIEDLKKYKHDIFHKSQEEQDLVVFKIFKHIDTVVPSNEIVYFQPIEVSAGSYIAEATMTYINRTLINDAGVVLGLYRVNRENNSEDLLTTGSAGWFGKAQGSDHYSARQTVSVKTNIVVNQRKETIELLIKPIGMRNVSPIIHDPSSPCVLTLF